MKRLLCLTWCVLAAPALLAQAPKAIHFDISSATPARPALKLRLLPSLRDTRSGNAVFHYQRAHNPEFFSALQRSEDFDKFYDWLTLPLDKFPADKARAFLPTQVLNEIDAGARRSHCDWELMERLRKDGIYTLLPEVQVARTFGNLLGLRARLEIHDKKYDKAVYTLQSGYSLARHVSEGPTLINALVGLNITNTMNKQLETLIQQPDAPNLYWSLTHMPRPFIDIRIPLEGEALMVEALFPNVRDAIYKTPGKVIAPVEIQTALDSLSEVVGDKNQMRVMAAIYAAKVYPEAKKFFLEEGWTEEQFRALPVTQAALMYAVVDYDRELDDMVKLVSLPYWEARPRYAALTQRLREAKNGNSTTPGMLAQLIIPAVDSAVFTHVRTDRQLAALRTVEALRLYAAQEGKLPAALDAIKEVPLPLDPVTGKFFDYRVEGPTAHLVGGPPAGDQANERNSIHYEITLRK